MTEYAEIEDVNAIRESKSGLSILCLIEDRKIWVPKSLISPDSEISEEGDFGVLLVEEWFANQEELI